MSGLSLEQRLAQRGLLADMALVARRHHATLSEILGRQRYRRIVLARHAAWRDLRERGMSYPDIAWFWGVHHTTVLAACQKPAAEEVQQ